MGLGRGRPQALLLKAAELSTWVLGRGEPRFAPQLWSVKGKGGSDCRDLGDARQRADSISLERF